MIALSTHSRICNGLPTEDPNRLPLICERNHPVTREAENLLENYNYPQYQRNSEEAIQRLLVLNEGVARAGRLLQRDNEIQENSIYDHDSDFDLDKPNDTSDSYRTGVLEKERRAMMDDNGNPKAGQDMISSLVSEV
ncbi:hypothetical protein FVEN_g3697 [Fusarium venenatum]|uniref:Uncharacterized protein n=1 Tax=Fusarium venenatum TaxID=56646 RepID=A0A2L2SRP1_9HYPO|nr:uncharacterized protein FVRRES_13657 [Fusarium venenatum]KAG8358430.1 hypothetical protein FVEN_g3697 [Fusarium venenatum]CEI41608.1 unnamed protein product [Fusarium venenatum]